MTWLGAISGLEDFCHVVRAVGTLATIFVPPQMARMSGGLGYIDPMVLPKLLSGSSIAANGNVNSAGENGYPLRLLSAKVADEGFKEVKT